MRKFPQKIDRNGRIRIQKRRKVLRKPKHLSATYPGEVVAFDTVIVYTQGVRSYIITGIDLYSRATFALAVRGGTSRAAQEFFTYFTQVFPFPIVSILTDNGSEFQKYFEHHICNLHMTHYHTYPRTPKMNAHCERFNRTIQEEFVNFHSSLLLVSREHFNTKLIDYLIFYNTQRVHGAFRNKKTPLQTLIEYYTVHDHCRNG